MWPLRLRLQLFLLFIMKLNTSDSVVTSPRKEGNRYHYLNQQRPLWVLEDEVSSAERDISHITFTTTEKSHYPTYYQQYRRKKMIPTASFYRRTSPKSPVHIGIPKRYINPSHHNGSRPLRNTPPLAPMFWRRQQPLSIPVSETEPNTPSMPTFDSVPNNIDSTEDVMPPIFIYNGPKGELIMNTMLSSRQYSMEEPIPGQTLYPPTTPIFRPKPIVQRFRVPGQKETMNLTLIPFYAHEAIVPRFPFDNYPKTTTDSSEAVENTLATTALPPAVIYAAPVPPVTTTATTKPPTTSITPKPTKKRRRKKAKQYAVYRSPDEVHWRPTEATLDRFSDVTTPYPMVLANPLQNHRYVVDTFDVTTTPKPPTNFKLTYKDEDSQFQIVYVDESLENPISREATPTPAPRKRLRSSYSPKPLPLLRPGYSLDREYYAFPVYTLGKLLKPETSERPLLYTSHFPSYGDRRKTSENNVDTWFIMNSRYKGHRTRDGSKLLSSKYREVPPAETAQLPEPPSETPY